MYVYWKVYFGGLVYGIVEIKVLYNEDELGDRELEELVSLCLCLG